MLIKFTQRFGSWFTMATFILVLFSKSNAIEQSYVGINIGGVNDYDGLRLFADLTKTARDWTKAGHPNDDSKLANVDANNWPTEDADIFIWASRNMSGTYKISFTGQATVSTGWTTAAVSNVAYDPATNTTTANLACAIDSSENCYLEFTNTKRTQTSATNTGITNLKVMRPTQRGSATAYPFTAVFTDQAKSLISKFQAIRFMDYLCVNNNPVSSWASRTKGIRSSQNALDTLKGGYGGSYEYAILLCNETGKDAYITLPHNATNDYITKTAQLFKYGSDGVNPYTSTQSNPVFAPLNQNLKLYVEWSNEVWNTMFLQSQDNHTQAIAEVQAGGSPPNFDGATSDWAWAWRRTGKKAKEMSEIFRSVFGDAAMMTRVRPLLMWQQQNGQGSASEPMALLVRYYGNSRFVTNPHPVSYWFYGGRGTSYYSPDNGSDALTLDNIWTNGGMDPTIWYHSMKPDANFCSLLGLKRIAYEGGPGLDRTGHSDAVKAAVVTDPRVLQSMKDNKQSWDRVGGGLYMYYSATGDFQWGFTDDVYTNLSTYKLQAIDYFNTNARAAVTYSTVAPCTFSRPTLGEQSTENPDTYVSTQKDYQHWVAYVFRASPAGTFKLTLDYTDANTSTFSVIGDGALLGTETVSGSGTSRSYSMNCDAGLHSVLLSADSGFIRFAKCSISVDPGSITASKSFTGAKKDHLRGIAILSSLAGHPRIIIDLGQFSANEKTRTSITGLSGRVVNQNTTNTRIVEIETSGLSKGMYVVSAGSGKSVLQRKLLID